MTDDVDKIASRTEIIPYPETEEDLTGFDCGKDWFNDFINTSEINEYHEEQFGITRLVFYDDQLAGFFSLSANALRDSDYGGDEVESIEDLSSYPYDIPAYLLGHLAVDNEFQNNGLGKFLLFHTIARSKQSEIPFRILLLHAQEDVVEFYKRHGFVESQSKDGFPKLMFMDLAAISDPF